jgi:hypothetical protein
MLVQFHFRECISRKYVLEAAGGSLPATIQLNPYLDTSEDHLFSALEIDTKLDNIAIIDGKRSRFGTGRTEPYMVEKRARGALDVPDKPATTRAPEFAVASTNDLGFKTNWCSRWNVRSRLDSVVPFRPPTDFYDLLSTRQDPRLWAEHQRGALCPRVLVCSEPDRRELMGHAMRRIVGRSSCGSVVARPRWPPALGLRHLGDISGRGSAWPAR